MRYILAITTTTNDNAEHLAKKIVESRLCACVNIIEGIRSIYHWKGKIEDETECILLMKTESRLEEDLRARLLELHPYETPEFVTYTINSGSSHYLEWISSSVAS